MFGIFAAHYLLTQPDLIALWFQPDRVFGPDAVEVLASNRANHSLYEGMRERHVGNSLDFPYLEHPKIRLPFVESIQRIVIRAEIFRQTVPANGAMEH